MNAIKKTVLTVGLTIGLCASVLAQATDSGTIGVAGLGPTPPARALIGYTGVPNTFTNLVITNSIAAQTTNTLANQPYPVVPGYDMGLEVYYLTAGVSGQASNAVTTVNGTVDGINWQTKPIFTLLSKLDGTNGVRFYTNFASSAISSLAALRVETIGNSDTNLITNAVVKFTRPKKPVAPPGLSTITTGFQ